MTDKEQTSTTPVHITAFEAENVKRVKAVALAPSATGLTVIGGRNAQGKTSVLDAIAWALGGDKFKPSEPRHAGSVLPPSLKVELSNGIRVERSGASSSLKVIDPQGNKAGQTLLNSFIEALALDIPKFIASSSKDKAGVLLEIVGVGDKLYELQKSEKIAYDERTAIGRIRDQKQAAADEMPDYPNAPVEPVSAAELISQQQEILTRNGENQRLREQVNVVSAKLTLAKDTLANAEARKEAALAELARIEADIAAKQGEVITLNTDLLNAQRSAQEITDESTAELEESIAKIDEINSQVRTNQAKAQALEEAEQYASQYSDLSERIDELRAQQKALLDGADLPLAGLSVQDGELTYNQCKWDCMSASEQLQVAVAIVHKLKPQCGFVLLDKLEQMDTQTLTEFGKWLETLGLQAIATRVSTGDECQIIIEDGMATHANDTAVTKADQDGQSLAEWKEGGF
jgi:DNA repair exonuclease SbcCD ATPase subunit